MRKRMKRASLWLLLLLGLFSAAPVSAQVVTATVKIDGLFCPL